MRPLELVLDGFRSFAGRTVIDWRGRRLVAVVGPIGSGKTSILDAVAFALYGKTPVFERESKTLIHHGRDHARVELGFEAGGETWRVIRVIRRAGSSRHVLYRQTGEEGTAFELGAPESDKEREVSRRIEDLLGLDFPTFCRSVLLAQNRFAEFLHASPGDRDRVLKGVFGFDRLDAMHALARERRGAAELALRELQGRLATVEEDRHRLGELRGSLAAAEEEKARLEAAEERAGILERQTEQARQHLHEARERQARLAEIARQLPAAADVASLADALATAVGHLERLEATSRTRHAAVAEAEALLEATRAETGSAETLARAESRLENLRRAEDALAKRRQQRQAVEEERRRRQAELERARSVLKEALQAERRARQEAAARTAEHAAAREASEAVEHRLGGREALARARDELGRFRAERDALDRARDAHFKAEQRLATVEVELAQAAAERVRIEGEEAAATKARKQAAAALVQAQEDRHRVERAEMAHALAATLEPGKPCPVCDQPVRTVQRKMAPENLARAVGALDAARAAAEAAAARLLESSRQAAAWRQAREGHVRRHEELVAERDAARQRLVELDEACGRRLEALRRLLGDGDPDDRLAAADKALESADDRLRAAEEEERQSSATLRSAEHVAALAQQDETSARGAFDTVLHQAEDAATEHRDAEAVARVARDEVEALLGRGEEEAEARLHAARSRLAAAEAQLTTAREDERAVIAELRMGRERVGEAREKEQAMTRRLAGLAGQLGQVAEPEEGRSLRDWSAAVQARLESSIRAAADAARAATESAAEARAATDGLHTSLGLTDVSSFQAALAAARAVHAQQRASVAELEERVERAQKLESELQAKQARHTLYAQLAEDLVPSKFLRYLLDEERAALAELGSERFAMLTEGRYRFTADGGFDVVDGFNADAERRSDTLSGGETFLASLALALALAEKVTAGGGRLDAFFLDEGFGSLDPEHLDLALAGIERLVTDAPNRLVTVVSHVAELRDRIEDRIELDRDPLSGQTIVSSGRSAGD